MLVYSDALPFKEKTANQKRTAQRTQPHAAGPRNAEPPPSAEPAVFEIPDSKGRDSVEQLSSGSDSGCEGGMPSTWPEWSDAEDELQEMRLRNAKPLRNSKR